MKREILSHTPVMTIEKYLSTYGEPRADQHDLILNEYRYILVIPSYNEGEQFIENLLSLSHKNQSKVLCIVVVNEPTDAKSEALETNRCFIHKLVEKGRLLKEKQDQKLIRLGSIDILLMGPFALNKKMGVGHARKIGGDRALELIAQGKIYCPLIYFTDADAKLPQNYFEQAENVFLNTKFQAAFIYPFIHLPPQEKKQQRAIELYEKRLHHYVDGLRWAQSPYAFHTIGSTIAVAAKSYAQVRGFPKVAAGEDFYLLNKLKKVGEITALRGSPIELSARISARVPFGTGPALARIMEWDNPDDAPIFYHPAVFKYVRLLLVNYQEFFNGHHHGDTTVDTALVREGFLSLQGAKNIGRHLSLRKTEKDRKKAFHDWFDAYRTLKFVHFLRDHGFSMQSFNEYKTNEITIN